MACLASELLPWLKAETTSKKELYVATALLLRSSILGGSTENIGIHTAKSAICIVSKFPRCQHV